MGDKMSNNHELGGNSIKNILVDILSNEFAPFAMGLAAGAYTGFSGESYASPVLMETIVIGTFSTGVARMFRPQDRFSKTYGENYDNLPKFNRDLVNEMDRAEHRYGVITGFTDGTIYSMIGFGVGYVAGRIVN